MYSCGDNFFGPLWQNGPTSGEFYNFPGSEIAHTSERKQHQVGPLTVGTSVIGIAFDGGVMIAADNLISYGSLARFRDVQRVFAVNNKTIIGTGGDYADFQQIKIYIDQKIIEDVYYGDNLEIKPKSLYNWLTRLFYSKRSDFNPFFTDMVVGGLEDGTPFLGHVDLRGKSYTSKAIATGMGKHLALPLLREVVDSNKPVSQAEASQLIRKCMEVMYYRDARAFPQFTVAVCTTEGTVIQGPINVSQNWEQAKSDTIEN